MIFTKKKTSVPTDAELQAEVGRLERARAEIARRAKVRKHSEEVAEAEADAKRDAARVATLQADVKSTAATIEKETADLEKAVLGLRSYERLDAARAELYRLREELHALGATAPASLLKPLSPAAYNVAVRVLTPLAIELGCPPVVRPLLTFR
jgi:hypothetical protein